MGDNDNTSRVEISKATPQDLYAFTDSKNVKAISTWRGRRFVSISPKNDVANLSINGDNPSTKKVSLIKGDISLNEIVKRAEFLHKAGSISAKDMQMLIKRIKTIDEVNANVGFTILRVLGNFFVSPVNRDEVLSTIQAITTLRLAIDANDNFSITKTLRQIGKDYRNSNGGKDMPPEIIHQLMRQYPHVSEWKEKQHVFAKALLGIEGIEPNHPKYSLCRDYEDEMDSYKGPDIGSFKEEVIRKYKNTFTDEQLFAAGIHYSVTNSPNKVHPDIPSLNRAKELFGAVLEGRPLYAKAQENIREIEKELSKVSRQKS